MRDRWFWKQVLSFVAGFVCCLACFAVAVFVASESDAWFALALGVALGAVAIAVEFIVALRHGGIFFHDRQKVQARLAGNRRIRSTMFWATPLLVLAVSFLAGSILATFLAAVGAYVLPVLIVSAWRFVFRNDEVRALAA